MASDRDPVGETAALHPDRLAVRDGTVEVTWAQLDERVATLAGALRSRGVERGTRVAVVATPGLEPITAVHACVRLGASVVPLSPRAPQAEVGRQLADCRPAVVLDEEALTALRRGVAERIEAQPVTDDQEVCVVYTSGSTASPKGVRLTLGNHRASAAGCAHSLRGLDPDDVWLLALGPHRVGGFAVLMRSALFGFAVDVLPRFDEATVVAAFEREEGATLASFVPAMLARTLDRGGAGALRRARALLLGGAPAPARDVREWAAAGLAVCPSYGLSETCSQIATVPPGEAAAMAGTAGMVNPFASVDVGDGEIVVHGPVVSPGYVDPAAGTGFVGAPPDHRFRTGDLGTFDERGALVVTGRVDLTINTGGEKVAPEEVEAVLAGHRGVADAAVRGVPDAVYGQRVEALIVGDAEVDDLAAWCRDRLAPHKVPRQWTFVDALPRSEDGKLLRRELGIS
ncbi:MAG TPA: AMP-binding protein [Acidimicrobiales bacterium]